MVRAERMTARWLPSLFRTASALALILVLGACTQGGQFDPTEILSSDSISGKKKLQGDREPLFPQGVPGAETGVPPDLVKGYQPAPEPVAAAESDAATKPAAAEKSKSASKPRPKPKVAHAPTVTPQTNQSGQSPWPPAQAAPAKAQPAQANWPPPPQPAQTNWPPPPQPAGQPAPGTAAQTNWPPPPRQSQ